MDAYKKKRILIKTGIFWCCMLSGLVLSVTGFILYGLHSSATKDKCLYYDKESESFNSKDGETGRTLQCAEWYYYYTTKGDTCSSNHTLYYQERGACPPQDPTDRFMQDRVCYITDCDSNDFTFIDIDGMHVFGFIGLSVIIL